MRVVALPGFLGVAQDWTRVVPDACVPDIPVLPLWESADWLNKWACDQPAPRLLAGYSLGGRVALHALIRRPDLWNLAVILSAHTGLAEQQQKEARLLDDLGWASRFRQDPWAPLMHEWNQRGALKTSGAVIRQESNYCREKLARSMDVWSLGRQSDLKPLVESLDIPILWFAGADDFSFCQIARALKFKHLASHATIIPACGHRILHDKPEIIAKKWPWMISRNV